jgi:hypothetical protein
LTFNARNRTAYGPQTHEEGAVLKRKIRHSSLAGYWRIFKLTKLIQNKTHSDGDPAGAQAITGEKNPVKGLIKDHN